MDDLNLPDMETEYDLYFNNGNLPPGYHEEHGWDRPIKPQHYNEAVEFGKWIEKIYGIRDQDAEIEDLYDLFKEERHGK